MDTPQSARKNRRSNRKWWGILVAFAILGFACLGILMLVQNLTDTQDSQTIPIDLHSVLQADYSINQNQGSINPVKLDIIWDAINDREPDAVDLAKRQAAFQNSLLTPIPTVTPSVLTCQGIHFVYADQDTWIDSANPAVTHGSETYLELGYDDNNHKRLLLHFSINEVIPQNTLIHSARLEMDVKQTAGEAPPDALAFFNLISPFGEVDTNWSNQPQSNRQYRANELARDSIHVWDVTNIVRDWLAGYAQNRGLAIDPQTQANFSTIYYSREIVDQENRPPNSLGIPVGPRLIINCGGGLPVAVAVNPFTPTPTSTRSDDQSSPESNLTPDASTTPLAPLPTATSSPLPTTTSLPDPSATVPLQLPTATASIAAPTPTQPAPTPTPTTGLIFTPTPTPTPVPDDGGGNNGGGNDNTPTPVPPRADLSVSKTANTTTPILGNPVNFTISIRNDGPNDTTNVQLRDLLPAGLGYISNTPSQGSYNSSSGIWTVGTITNNQTVNLTLVTTVTNAAAVRNTAQIIASDLSDPDSTPNNGVDAEDDQSSVDITPALPTLAINDITVLESSAIAVFTVTLSGPINLPVSVNYSTADGTALDTLDYTGQFSQVINFPPGNTIQNISINLLPDAIDEIDENFFVNLFTPTNAAFGDNQGIATIIDDDTQADLSITKTDSPDPVVAGQSLNYNISILNNGPSDAQNVMVTDTLPQSVTISSVSIPTTTQVGQTLSWNLGTLTNGATFSFDVNVVVSPAYSGTLTNTASVTSTTQDIVPLNNTTSQTTTVIPMAADLSVSKTVNNSTPFVGDTITYTVTINNAGPDNTTNVDLSDLLPAGLGFVSDSPSQGSYNSGSGLWSVGTITQSESVTLTLVVTAANAGTFTNTAQITASDQPDPNSIPGNNNPGEDDQASVVITATIPAADLTISKDDTPDLLAAGEILTYTLTITNNGPVQAQNVVVTDTLPLSITLLGANPAPTSQNGQILSWNLANLANGASQSIIISATVDPAFSGTLTNTAIVTSTTLDPGPGPNSATEITLVTTDADLVITKSDNPDPVTAGQLLAYTLSITNNGPSDAQNVIITDTLPLSVTFASATAGCTEAAGLVTCTSPSLSAGANLGYTIVVTVDTAAASTLTNTAIVTSTTNDPTPANNSTTQVTTVNNQADLLIIKADTPDPVIAGELLAYTLNITNSGPSVATNLTISDTLPAGVIFALATAGCTEAGGIVTCTAATLGVGASLGHTIVVTVTPAFSGTLTNTAAVTSTTADPTPGNNSSTVTTTVNSQADLAIIKSDAPDPVVPGQTLTYTLTISNSGPSEAQNVVITDTLPLSVTLAAASGCSAAGNIVTCTVASLGVGANIQQTIVVTVDSGFSGVLTNTAEVTGTNTDPTPGNNTAVVTTSVTAADLSLTKVAASSLAASKMYWTDSATSNIQRANLDGTSVEELVTGQGNPWGIALDIAAGKMYWANNSGGDKAIRRANLDGSNVEDLVTSGLSNPLGFALDVAAGKMYWTDNGGGARHIQRANLDGSSPEILIGLSNPQGIALDVAAGKMYWSDSGTGDIRRANLDGTSPEILVTGIANPQGIALDVAAGKIYWVSAGPGEIWRANLNGSSPESLVTGLSNPQGIALDVAAGKLYWIDSSTGNIQRANLDGSNSENVLTGLGTPRFIALDLSTTSSTAVFSITLTNDGPDTATNVTVEDILPAGLTFSGAGASQGSYSSGTNLWNVGTLTNSTSATLAITTTISTDGTYTNTAQVLAVDQADTDSTPGNNIETEDDQDSAVITVVLPPSLSISDVSVAEGNSGSQAAVFTVSLSATSAQTVTVDYATSDSLATAGSDYQAASSTLTFPPGTTVQTFTVVISGDTTFEPDETFIVSLSSAGNATITDDLGIGTILNDDTGADLSVSKTVNTPVPLVGDPITFTVTIANAGPLDATNVDLSDPLPAGSGYVSNSPSQGSYDSGTGLWTVGTITNSESVTLTLVATATGAGTFTNTAQITASDQLDLDSTPGNSLETEDDQDSAIVTPTLLPTLSINDVTVSEGDSGTVTATFTVDMSAVSASVVTVNYATADNTATLADSDYIIASGTLTFTPGTTVQTFTVQIQGDTIDESDEVYFVNLSGEVNAAIADGQGVGTIIDDDNPSLSINDVSVTEGDSSSVSVVFTVTLSAVGVQTATVDYATANGTALAPGDYTFANGTVTFPPGVTQQTLTVTVIGDVTIEGDETFQVNLSNPGEATIGDGQGIGTIIDNDTTSLCSSPVTTLTATRDTHISAQASAQNENFGQAGGIDLTASPGERRGLVQFDLASIPANSVVSCASLILYRSGGGGSGQTIDVHRVTNSWVEGDGTDTNGATWNQPDKSQAATWTTAGGDFDSSAAASFTAGSGDNVVNIASLAQFWLDNPGNNYGLLLAMTGSSFVEFASLQNIDGNPVPRLTVEYIPGLVINDASVTEGNSGTTNAVLTVTLSSAAAQTVTVNYATADNTATIADSDYNSAGGTLTFLPGITTQTITVTVNGDLNHEANETFLVNLSNPANAGIADGQGVGTILNDEIGGTMLAPSGGRIFLPIIMK